MTHAENDTFWVVSRCSCGCEMAMREGATWPMRCPACGKPEGIWPPRPNFNGRTQRELSNGRLGLHAEILPEDVALRRARGWKEQDLDAPIPPHPLADRKPEPSVVD